MGPGGLSFRLGVMETNKRGGSFLRINFSVADGTVTDRKSSGAPSPDDVSPAVPELTSLLGELRYITRRMRSDEEREEVISDWKFAAMVIDRLCFYVFSAYLLMLSVVFFGLAVSR